jgi:hypothetical protein
MTWDRRRLAGLALVVGGLLTIAGYGAVNVIIGGGGDLPFSDPRFVPFYGVALAGDLLVVLGLPVILAAHGARAAKLTTVGYVGVMLAIVMLNIGEGTTEAFVKPYLITHGGIPDPAPAGFEAFVNIALVALIVGLVSLGVAVIRARVFPVWVGVLLLVSLPLSIVSLPAPLGELGDYVGFFAFLVLGWSVAFGRGLRETISSRAQSGTAVA